MSALKDLTGQTFGRLTVVSRAENTRGGKARWNCLCECGSTCVVQGDNLRSRHTESCGCLGEDVTSERLLMDLTGQKFGNLTVLSRAYTDSKYSGADWLCECVCGNKVTVGGRNMRRGLTKSCGCSFRKDIAQTNIIYALTDPFDDTVIYIGHTVQGLKERLKKHLAASSNPNHPHYPAPICQWIRDNGEPNIVPIEENVPHEKRIEREGYWQKQFDNLLNLVHNREILARVRV